METESLNDTSSDIKKNSQKAEKISKFDILVFNNGWNDKNEKLIVSIGENAASYKWMHQKSFGMYTNLNRMISLLIVCSNAILTAQSAFQGTYTECEATFFQKILIYIVTALSIVYSFLRFQETATNHQNAIKNFSELYHEIQQQMCLYRKDRIKATKYIQTIMRKYDTLTTDSPRIPDFIVYLFKREYKHSDIALPDIVDKIHKIDIMSNENNVQASLSKITDLSKQNGNLLLENEITEEDAKDLEDYLKIQAKDARVRYEFDRWNSIERMV
jgi:hypothetical protein